MSDKQSVKRRVRHLVDRVALPYVEAVRAGVRADFDQRSRTIGDGREHAPAPVTAPRADTTVRFHHVNHELRTLELERVPKGARRVLSVGAQGRWYFDWFEQAYGPVDEHIGIEAFEPEPDDLQPYVTWIPDTADKMEGVTSGTIQLVYAGQTSEHLWSHELVGFLCEAYRVLEPGGQLVLDSPNRLVTQHLYWSHGGHTIELSVDEMTDLLRLAGFEVDGAYGIWSCTVGGRLLQLEEGLDDAAVFVRRSATGRDAPDDCFVWWINARRVDREPDVTALEARVDQLFAEHWNTRVCRGMFPATGATALPVQRGATGAVASSLPFPMHAGSWQLSARLEEGAWADLQGFRIDIAAPGDHLVHRLYLEDATIDGPVARWTMRQPYLLFALAMSVHIGTATSAAVLRLPIELESIDG
jgi:hypothetical protein